MPTRLATCLTVAAALAAWSPARGQEVVHYFPGLDDDGAFGIDVANAGDLDLDGHDDVLVRGRTQDFRPFVRAHSGHGGQLLFQVGRELGAGGYGRLDRVGDLNGDGRDEFVVGYPFDSEVFESGGALIVYSGADGAVVHAHAPEHAEDQLGWSVAGVGDTNGDGVPDYAAGILRYATPVMPPGAVQVYSGADGSLLHHFDGPAPFTFYGTSVAAAGDVDGDGHADVLAGGYGNVNGVTAAGRVRVHSGRTGEVLHEWLGTEYTERLGTFVAGGADLDGDGVPDVATSVDSYSLTGRVRTYSGATGAVLAESTEPTGSVRDLSFVGDLDGDGLSEVGAALGFDVVLLSGVDLAPMFVVPDAAAVVGMGFVNPDGLGDLLVGLPYASEGQTGGAAATILFGPCSIQPLCTTSPNSAGLGAVVVAEGSGSLSANDLALSAHFAPPGGVGLFLYAHATTETPFGDGVLCLSSQGGGIHRLNPAQLTGPDGVAWRALDFTAPPFADGPGAVLPGRPWYAQFWYRDPLGPGGSGFNLSDAIRVVLCP